MKNLFNNSTIKEFLVERVISEIRRGIPVLLYNDNTYLLVSSSELLNENSLRQYLSFSQEVYLLLTYNRSKYITNNQTIKYNVNRILIQQNHSLNDISSMIGQNNNNNQKIYSISQPKILDQYAINLIKFSKLLPSALVIDLNINNYDQAKNWCNKNGIMSISTDEIDKHKASYSLTEVCKSPLYLQNCNSASIVIYRPYTGDLEHYAIIIDKPNYEEPIVRIHSSCYTGDLLNSLSCDCRNQLHYAIKTISEYGGGIILYLAQDGRGIGLVNKIRTYQMQIHNHFDTVDANRFFGFEDDERTFDPAVKILQNLNISKLQLLTNNPNKISNIEKYGITVTKHLPIFTQCNKYNENYINTKIKRLGHIS